MTISLAVLISGNGSNLQAIINACASGKLPATIKLIVSNRASAYGITRAKDASIPYTVVEHEKFNNRESFDQELIEKIEPYQPDYIILAGFMRKLSSVFIKKYQHRILNIHPSLLPKYPSLNTYEKALNNSEKYHGTTIHFATENLDQGPIIAQIKIPVLANDTISTLKERTQLQEHHLYPKVIKWLADKRLINHGDKLTFDTQVIPSSGLILPAQSQTQIHV